MKFFGFDVLEESEVHYGAPPLLVGMLERGDLDAVIMLDPEVVRMLESGKYRSIGNLGRVWREFSGSDALLVTVVMNEEWAEANRDVATRFVTAFQEAVEYLLQDDEVWVELGDMLNIRTPEGVALLRERTAAAFTLKWDEEVVQEQHAFIADVRNYFGEADGIPEEIPAGTFRLDFVR